MHVFSAQQLVCAIVKQQKRTRHLIDFSVPVTSNNTSQVWRSVGRFTVGAVWVGSRWAGQTGGVVAVVVAGVAGRAGFSLPCCRQLHGPRNVLHADFWLHPTIQHLCLYPKKPQSLWWVREVSILLQKSGFTLTKKTSVPGVIETEIGKKWQ